MRSYVVRARVLELAKELNVRVSGGAVEALDSRIEEMIKMAVQRAKANGRKTIKSQDF